MDHVKKVCPICGREFFVLENVAEKAVYCTLECLEKAQEGSGVREEFLVAGE
ncbi:hypothetical protein [Methanosarcina sp. MTP4]|uniref:hypothetical protein n=1 Tax=Methanosarcina sp. MTP4 TaxID=1434100 RepID=UPI000AB2333F|nr:hypothetical protein [Methanosarcina sp. MTP4]